MRERELIEPAAPDHVLDLPRMQAVGAQGGFLDRLPAFAPGCLANVDPPVGSGCNRHRVGIVEIIALRNIVLEVMRILGADKHPRAALAGQRVSVMDFVPASGLFFYRLYECHSLFIAMLIPLLQCFYLSLRKLSPDEPFIYSQNAFRVQKPGPLSVPFGVRLGCPVNLPLGPADVHDLKHFQSSRLIDITSSQNAGHRAPS
jgi:hypothetical protein